MINQKVQRDILRNIKGFRLHKTIELLNSVTRQVIKKS